MLNKLFNIRVFRLAVHAHDTLIIMHTGAGAPLGSQNNRVVVPKESTRFGLDMRINAY